MPDGPRRPTAGRQRLELGDLVFEFGDDAILRWWWGGGGSRGKSATAMPSMSSVTRQCGCRGERMGMSVGRRIKAQRVGRGPKPSCPRSCRTRTVSRGPGRSSPGRSRRLIKTRLHRGRSSRRRSKLLPARTGDDQSPSSFRCPDRCSRRCTRGPTSTTAADLTTSVVCRAGRPWAPRPTRAGRDAGRSFWRCRAERTPWK